MSSSEPSNTSPFDPEIFRAEGHLLVDTLAEYLKMALSDKDMSVLPWKDPEEMVKHFSFESRGGEKEPFNAFVKRILENVNHLHSPRYIGHQVTAPLPLTALISMCTFL